ncbi:MAG: RNA-binding S4 domain-containing protein [Deltaproteobacteria bacterium]|nr:RNA-binding S4 domain-containing protein [Deltaproteobacteria bacterium]
MTTAESVRLDKWLWAARFFKTRSLAAEAAQGGKVHVRGDRAKPARPVRIGDRLEIRRGPWEWVVTVKGLSTKRGPASEAALLYEETEESARKRDAARAEARSHAAPLRERGGRPTKKDRRDRARFARED